MWAAVVNTLGKTKTSKKTVRKKVSKVVVVVEPPLRLPCKSREAALAADLITA